MDITHNINDRTAMLNAAYYDVLWRKLGAELDYTELARAYFVIDSIRHFLGGTKPEILDLGCGRGWMSQFLCPLGRVTGLDFSEGGIGFAKQHYGDFAQFVLGNPQARNLGMPEDVSFNAVVCSEVIEHVTDPSKLLNQISALLVPRGWCLLTTPNGNVWEQFRRDSRYIPHLQPIEQWLRPNELAGLLSKSGFEVRRHEGRPVYEFRIGLPGTLQRRSIERLFNLAGLGSTYGRLIRPTSLYQVVVAQKVF